MTASRWMLVLCIAVLVGSCSGSQPDDNASEPGAGSETDSLTQPQAPAPSPGTATVRGAVRSCDPDADPVTCELRIDEVVAYGASTPPMGTGTRTVSVRPAVLKDRTVEALTSDGTHTLTLRHSGDRPRMGEEDEAPTWALASVLK